MKGSYPEVETDYARLSAYAIAEEQTFLRTLAAGSAILDQSVADAKQGGATTLSGSEAFLLHDTYGFRSTSRSRSPKRRASPSTAARSTP